MLKLRSELNLYSVPVPGLVLFNARVIATNNVNAPVSVRLWALDVVIVLQ
jgi:hypothetical protein